MIKAIKKRLSVKIFIVTFILLGLACCGTFLCISKMLPLTYSDLLNDNIDKKAIQLVEQLSDCNSISESENILKNFSDETNSVFWVEDEYGNLVYPKGANTETELFSGDTTITFERV